jgi:hypothetical protein
MRRAIHVQLGEFYKARIARHIAAIMEYGNLTVSAAADSVIMKIAAWVAMVV